MPGEQVLLDAQRRWPRATSSSRSAASRSAPTAPCSPSHRTSSATSASCCGSRTSTPASAPRRGARHRLRRRLVAGRALRSSTPGRRRVAAGQGVAARARHAREDDVLVHQETDERFWTGSGASRNDRFLIIASRLARRPPSPPPRRRRPRPASPRVVAPRREGVEYAVEHRRGDRLLVAAQRRAPTSTLARRRSTPRPPTSGRRCVPSRPGGAPRGRRRVRRPPRRVAAQRDGLTAAAGAAARLLQPGGFGPTPSS